MKRHHSNFDVYSSHLTFVNFRKCDANWQNYFHNKTISSCPFLYQVFPTSSSYPILLNVTLSYSSCPFLIQFLHSSFSYPFFYRSLKWLFCPFLLPVLATRSNYPFLLPIHLTSSSHLLLFWVLVSRPDYVGDSTYKGLIKKIEKRWTKGVSPF